MGDIMGAVGEIVREVTGHGNLTPDIDFVKDLALNSFEIVNIVCEIERRFDIRIPTRDIWNLNQMRDVAGYLEERGASIGP